MPSSQSAKRPKIFCMEGAWSGQATDVRTVMPVLEALTAASQIRSIRNHLSSLEDLQHQFEQWGKPHLKSYRIGYLALHGSPGAVWVGNEKATLRDLAAWSGGKLEGKVIHFGSCETLRTSDARLEEFLVDTKARAVTGFRRQVDWFESLAFEVLLFSALTSYQRPSDSLSYLQRQAGDLIAATGFVMSY